MNMPKVCSRCWTIWWRVQKTVGDGIERLSRFIDLVSPQTSSKSGMRMIQWLS